MSPNQYCEKCSKMWLKGHICDISKNKNVHFSSKTDDWETPQDFFDKLNKEFMFDLDVCATKENTKCKRWYELQDDGLSKPWLGHRVWMNPPYGRGIGKWVKKAHDTVLGVVQNHGIVVCLLPARTDTKWFHDYILGKAEIRFIKGRLKFGNSKNSAPFPSMIVVFNSPHHK